MTGTAASTPNPSRGDVVRCTGCGTLRRHTRILALCGACGRGVHVVARPRGHTPLATALATLLSGVTR